MEKKTTVRKIMIGFAVALFSLPASAQLSLSAKAKADTKEGVGATGDADAATKKAEAPAETTATAETAPSESTEPTLPPPPPAPVAVAEPEPEMEEMAPAAEEPDTNGVAGYDGGFFIQTNDGKFKLKINGIAKARWDFVNDEFPVVSATGAPGTNHTMHSTFAVPYARVGLSGNFMSPDLGYNLMWDFAANKAIYAYMTYAFIPKKLVIQVGRFKRPISRTYITSSAKLMFIDGPLGQMGQGIDVGIQLGNNYTAASGLEWAISVFNGTVGAATGGYSDFSPVLVGRIGYNNGIKGYSDSDFEGGPLRLGVALSASTEFDHDNDDITTHVLSMDAAIKVAGLHVSGAGYMQTRAVEGFWDVDDNNTDPNGDNTETSGISAFGAFIQAGYLINNMIEPCGRYAMQNNFYTEDDLHQRISAGLALHFFPGHKLKWQNEFIADIQHDTDPADPDKTTSYQDLGFSTQLQFFF